MDFLRPSVSTTTSEKRLNIASLQGRIAQAIASSQYEIDDPAPLQKNLLVANDLLNQYAIPYDLFECCLLSVSVT